MAYPEENKLIAVDFAANLDEGNAELETDCLTLRIPSQKVCRYKCQFCTKVCAS